MKAKYFFIIFFIFVVGCKTKQKTILEEEKPVVLLISIDGFRYDYIHKVITAGINQIRNGVEAEWLIPSFPSKTFPNHYTIVTGLYPEHHGIIANNMYDDNFNAVYRISDTKEKNNSRWWGGEPIWVTAEKQGLTSACFFWPGSEAAIQNVRPRYWKNYDHNFPNINRVDTILHWMNLPKKADLNL
jgi:predicted AlkP superfamily pyrophosphatase or phosphodiesterase